MNLAEKHGRTFATNQIWGAVTVALIAVTLVADKLGVSPEAITIYAELLKEVYVWFIGAVIVFNGAKVAQRARAGNPESLNG